MNTKGIKKFIYTTMLLSALAIAVSSCNRGIGCPSDFSVKQIAAPVVSSLFNIR